MKRNHFSSLCTVSHQLFTIHTIIISINPYCDCVTNSNWVFGILVQLSPILSCMMVSRSENNGSRACLWCELVCRSCPKIGLPQQTTKQILTVAMHVILFYFYFYSLSLISECALTTQLSSCTKFCHNMSDVPGKQ